MGPEESTSSSTKVKAYSIPKLAADGSNWITWKQQTLLSLMLNKGVQKYLDGTARVPPQSLHTTLIINSMRMS